MVDGSKFNDHNSGGHFKNSAILVIKLKLQVRLSCSLYFGIHFYGIRISTFLKKKRSGDEAENCPVPPLKISIFHYCITVV